MLRIGFILGFLAGGVAAALLVRPEEGEPGGLGVAAPGATRSGLDANPVLQRIKQQLGEAREAAREAQMEKEAELNRMYDELVRNEDGGTGR